MGWREASLQFCSTECRVNTKVQCINQIKKQQSKYPRERATSLALHVVRRPRLGVRIDNTTITSLRLHHGTMIMFNNDAYMRTCECAHIPYSIYTMPLPIRFSKNNIERHQHRQCRIENIVMLREREREREWHISNSESVSLRQLLSYIDCRRISDSIR